MLDRLEILHKYFGDKRILYFHSSDALALIEGDTYLRYQNKNKVEIWFGGENGEVCLISTENMEKIETLIKTIIY